MRPVFILLALTAVVVAQPFEAAPASTDVALNPSALAIINNWDTIVEEAYQEWLDAHDHSSIEAASDGKIQDDLKDAGNKVKDVAVGAAKAGYEAVKAEAKDALKKAAPKALSAAHDHVQQHLTGLGGATRTAAAHTQVAVLPPSPPAAAHTRTTVLTPPPLIAHTQTAAPPHFPRAVARTRTAWHEPTPAVTLHHKPVPLRFIPRGSIVILRPVWL